MIYIRPPHPRELRFVRLLKHIWYELVLGIGLAAWYVHTREPSALAYLIVNGVCSLLMDVFFDGVAATVVDDG